MYVSPMLLEKIHEPFDSNDYITELKLDGIRLILSYFDGKFRLFTRHHNEVTDMFPELYSNLNVHDGTVLDGELIVTDKEGKSDFEAVMATFRSKKSGHYIQFCVFDVKWIPLSRQFFCKFKVH